MSLETITQKQIFNEHLVLVLSGPSTGKLGLKILEFWSLFSEH